MLNLLFIVTNFYASFTCVQVYIRKRYIYKTIGIWLLQHVEFWVKASQRINIKLIWISEADIFSQSNCINKNYTMERGQKHQFIRLLTDFFLLEWKDSGIFIWKRTYKTSTFVKYVPNMCKRCCTVICLSGSNNSSFVHKISRMERRCKCVNAGFLK